MTSPEDTSMNFLIRMQGILRSSLLNKSGVEWTDYNCNHYVGCRHNCSYCYAPRFMKVNKRMWPRAKPVRNALELAVTEIRRVRPGATIMVSSCTDPYQPLEAKERLTRSLIPVLAGFRRTCHPPRVTIITKSNLVERDFDLIQKFPNIRLCMSITSMDPLPGYEPGAPPNTSRIQTLIKAHKIGIPTAASIEPWIPGVTRPYQLVKLLLPFTDSFIIGSWNHHYRKDSEGWRKAQRIYRAILPEVKDLLEAHFKEYIIKEELREWIE